MYSNCKWHNSRKSQGKTKASDNRVSWTRTHLGLLWQNMDCDTEQADNNGFWHQNCCLFKVGATNILPKETKVCSWPLSFLDSVMCTLGPWLQALGMRCFLSMIVADDETFRFFLLLMIIPLTGHCLSPVREIPRQVRQAKQDPSTPSLTWCYSLLQHQFELGQFCKQWAIWIYQRA